MLSNLIKEFYLGIARYSDFEIRFLIQDASLLIPKLFEVCTKSCYDTYKALEWVSLNYNLQKAKEYKDNLYYSLSRKLNSFRNYCELIIDEQLKQKLQIKLENLQKMLDLSFDPSIIYTIKNLTFEIDQLIVTAYPTIIQNDGRKFRSD